MSFEVNEFDESLLPVTICLLIWCKMLSFPARYYAAVRMVAFGDGIF
jgi:hypothetical protein